ncbi:hypothetical protein ON010_g17646 [Phytophthora cinnamomi]|nr:hypothetical protein ON010_g17646 [Phytophthora cinnamomi]
MAVSQPTPTKTLTPANASTFSVTAGTLMIIDDVVERFGQQNVKPAGNPRASGTKLTKTQSPGTVKEGLRCGGDRNVPSSGVCSVAVPGEPRSAALESCYSRATLLEDNAGAWRSVSGVMPVHSGGTLDACDAEGHGQGASGCDADVEDNQGAIALAQNAGYHARTKHVDIRHHFIRENVERGTVKVDQIDTKHRHVDEGARDEDDQVLTGRQRDHGEGHHAEALGWFDGAGNGVYTSSHEWTTRRASGE